MTEHSSRGKAELKGVTITSLADRGQCMARQALHFTLKEGPGALNQHGGRERRLTRRPDNTARPLAGTSTETVMKVPKSFHRHNVKCCAMISNHANLRDWSQ